VGDTFGEDILAPLDAVRAIGGMLNVRPFTVTVTRRVWSGSRPGLPGATHADQTVTLQNLGADGNLYPVMVEQVSRTDEISSGGQYAARVIKVGPMTPTYAASAFGPAGGFDDNSFDPAPTGQAVEMIWTVTSPNGTFGIPDAGTIFEKKGEEASSLSYYIYLQQTGRVPTP
jgi:hypothetical protein